MLTRLSTALVSGVSVWTRDSCEHWIVECPFVLQIHKLTQLKAEIKPWSWFLLSVEVQGLHMKTCGWCFILTVTLKQLALVRLWSTFSHLMNSRRELFITSSLSINILLGKPCKLHMRFKNSFAAPWAVLKLGQLMKCAYLPGLFTRP